MLFVQRQPVSLLALTDANGSSGTEGLLLERRARRGVAIVESAQF